MSHVVGKNREEPAMAKGQGDDKKGLSQYTTSHSLVSVVFGEKMISLT